MISFYPGPAQLEPGVRDFLLDAYDCGILSRNHRSSEFEQLMVDTKKTIFEKLSVPEEYTWAIASSATECWEIVGQSLIAESSIHLYNGAFGKKWADYTEKLSRRVNRVAFHIDQIPDSSIITNDDTICITSNETSNGTQLPVDFYIELRNLNKEKLICVDATSSLGGFHHDLSQGDVWFASVQKCFGLPSGMAIMLLSPHAVERAKKINERNHYNSLNWILDNMHKNQTPHTPNILDIYLLNSVLKNRRDIHQIDKELKKKHQTWNTWQSVHAEYIQFTTTNSQVRSITVQCFSLGSNSIANLIEDAENAGYQLGKGYGRWKDSTFRIANFPQHSLEQHKRLQGFLADYLA